MMGPSVPRAARNGAIVRVSEVGRTGRVGSVACFADMVSSAPGPAF